MVAIFSFDHLTGDQCVIDIPDRDTWCYSNDPYLSGIIDQYLATIYFKLCFID